MTYEEYKHLVEYNALTELTRKELVEEKNKLEGIVTLMPDDEYWKESLALVNEVLADKAYAQAVDEGIIENNLYMYGHP